MNCCPVGRWLVTLPESTSLTYDSDKDNDETETLNRRFVPVVTQDPVPGRAYVSSFAFDVYIRTDGSKPHSAPAIVGLIKLARDAIEASANCIVACYVTTV